MQTVTPDKEIIALLKESGGDQFRLCFQCGLCDSLCPWNKVTQFSIRGLLREAAFGLTEIEGEQLWRCTTCGRCVMECPRGVDQIEFISSVRKIAVEYDIFPSSVAPLRTVRASLTAEGNPFNEERAKRAAWADNLSVPKFNAETEFLYFPGCYLCYDARLRRVAAASVSLLNKAGVDFGILGERENCCGEAIRKAGFSDLFTLLAKENIKTFIDAGVKRIVVSSPHCYHTFRNEYPQFMVNFDVLHMVMLLERLFEEGRLRITKPLKRRVVWHDPCYLGRHNGVYEQPRRLLARIPEIELLEFEESREASLCCGGGGGRIWAETPKEERFSDIRVREALQLGAEILVTACPYCITNFEDSRLTLNAEERLQIKDITEILDEVTDSGN